MSLNRPIRHCFCAEIGKHPCSVGLAGGLHDPGDHQIPKHSVIDGAETEPVVDGAEHVVKQPRMRCGGAARRYRRIRGHTRRQRQRAAAPVGDAIDGLSPGGDLDIGCRRSRNSPC
jgi:hypothetical protein